MNNKDTQPPITVDEVVALLVARAESLERQAAHGLLNGATTRAAETTAGAKELRKAVDEIRSRWGYG